MLKQVKQQLENKNEEARKKETLIMGDRKALHENDFVKYFVSEHVMGSA